ncbi:hypothetical protein ACT4R9_11505 [Ornithobacterium rhinotracheale]|uniref:hypothetical protein n=1 Tax=Ornithobacterium rhinotracheale TaxID=28251 RepID=UPI003FA44E4C
MKKNIIVTALFLGMFIQGQTIEDAVKKCPNHSLFSKHLYKKEFLDLAMKILEKDVKTQSLYNNFDEAMKVLRNTLGEHGISDEKQEQIIRKIEGYQNCTSSN